MDTTALRHSRGGAVPVRERHLVGRAPSALHLFGRSGFVPGSSNLHRPGRARQQGVVELSVDGKIKVLN